MSIVSSGAPLRVTVSIGTATVDAARAKLGAEHVIARADRALYEAKRTGRNRVQTSA